MKSLGKTVSVGWGVVMLCIAMEVSPGAASEEMKLTGCLTKKGKLAKLEFGESPRKRCNNNQTLITFRVQTDQNDGLICRPRFAGTYLTTIRNSQGGFASRSLATLFKDGNLSVADSAESVAMFGQQQGSYRCIATDGARAITLDFGFSDPENIARSDWVIRMTPEGHLEGEITVNLYRPLETCNPLEEPSECDVTGLDTFTFTSVRVEPAGP